RVQRRVVGAVAPHPLDLLARGAGDLAAVVVAVGGALDHRVRGREHALTQRREQILLGEDQVGARAVGELELVGHRQRAGRARLDAQPAEDAPQVVDLVHAAVALAGRVLRLGAVAGALAVDRVRRARPRAQLAADALLQAVRVPVELVPAVEPRLHRRLLARVLLGDDRPEQRGHRDAEPRDGRDERLDRVGRLRQQVGRRGAGDVEGTLAPPRLPPLDLAALGRRGGGLVVAHFSSSPAPTVVSLDDGTAAGVVTRALRGDGGSFWPGSGGTG